MIRIKRTREEINASIKDRSCCYLCGKKLRTVSVLRTSDKACSSCRAGGKSDKASITKDHKALKAKKIEPSEKMISKLLNLDFKSLNPKKFNDIK